MAVQVVARASQEREDPSGISDVILRDLSSTAAANRYAEETV
jgi:hypothetical protein